ncbi:MAG TPA: sigma-54 dependent transcriptional regulator [Nitrospira sp.]|nr:sigma-54 dependent transcriptional regulator [Nitrospira sp.]HNC83350.1 sigma-54 dependent transcriptional regulator [Nitrospira sp.]HNP39074.1 sigma-54 dependent transcriptional regulator [Nitrospira sp.]
MTQARILIVDSNVGAATVLRDMLSVDGYEVSAVRDPKDAGGYLERIPVDLILTDLPPETEELTCLRQLRGLCPTTPIVLMTAHGSLRTAVEGLKAGAFDYMSKPFTAEEVRSVARRAVEHTHMRAEQAASGEAAPDDTSPFASLVGSSPAMVQVYKAIARVAQTDSSVLLQGESGTGKELIARAIHASGPRSSGPFVTVDGGALADSLLESELFGHERGSFTGAISSRKGLLEQAHSGTCFLDEVADLSPALQGKLLRVLQEKEIRRVGSTATTALDVRIIAASKLPLEPLVRAGTFREDLYYRMNVVTIDIPPLRERLDDLPLLAKRFLRLYGSMKMPPVTELSAEALALLRRYWWPGNVRELEHAIERAVTLSPYSVICPEDLPPAVKDAQPEGLARAQGWVTLEDLERNHILQVLDSHARDLGRSATILGIHRKTLLRKLRHYGLAAGYGVA